MVLIIIDGLDASGKNTQAFNLHRLLTKSGKTVYLRHHPSDDNFLGAKTKQFLSMRGTSAHFASALFYMLEVIRSILLYSWRRYDYIVFVRYLMGTAYLPSPLHKIAYHFFAFIVPTSNLMFFLDVSPAEAHRRIEKVRSEREMFETLAELQKTREKAISLASLGKWIVINADKPVAEVENQIMQAISQHREI